MGIDSGPGMGKGMGIDARTATGTVGPVQQAKEEAGRQFLSALSLLDEASMGANRRLGLSAGALHGGARRWPAWVRLALQGPQPTVRHIRIAEFVFRTLDARYPLSGRPIP